MTLCSCRRPDRRPLRAVHGVWVCVECGQALDPKGIYTIAVIKGVPRLLYHAEPRQHELHLAEETYILYGGAAGGGKSHALRWKGIRTGIRHANARILLLRREFTELEQTHLLASPKGAIAIDRIF